MWHLIVAHWSVCSDEEDGSPVITREGFQFLLLDTPSQVWYFILQYLDTVESRGLDLVDCLTFLFQLSFSTMGKVWSSYHTYDDRFSLVQHDVDFHRDLFTKCARCILCINSSPWFNCTAELLSPCHSVMLTLNFGAPAPKEVAALDVLSTWHTCYFCHWCNCVGWGEITVVDTHRHAVSCRHILTIFQVSCRRLVSALCHKTFIFIVLFSFYYLLLYFTSFSYLDSILFPFIILHYFKTN